MYTNRQKTLNISLKFQIMTKFKVLSFVILLLLSINQASSQGISTEMLEKAKALGLSNKDLGGLSKHYKKKGDMSDSLKMLKGKKNVLRGEEDVVLKPNNPYKTAALGQDSMDIYENAILFEFMEEQKTDEVKKLNVFGSDVFSNSKINFEPSLNIPTPIDYEFSIGDEVLINVWGDSKMSVNEIISPDGYIIIENLGPIYLNGLTSELALKKVKKEISKIIYTIDSSSQISLSLGAIRSIKVHLAGEIVAPGTYTVPSLATIIHLLYSSGGTTDIGNMRNIEIFRKSKKIASFDLYKFILDGEFKNNIILKDNDVIVVKPYETKAHISGAIKRGMYYQMKQNESLANIISYAGGFKGNAYKDEVKIYRSTGGYREILNINKEQFKKEIIQDGDSVVIIKSKNEFNNKLVIGGAVWYPGDFQLSEDTNTLSALIKKAGGIKGNAFTTVGMITRRNDDYTKSIIQFNTIDVATGKSDLALKNYDEIFIPIINSLKERYTIVVSGEVNNPGVLEYKKNMRIEDAIILSKGLTDAASLSFIDVSRRIRNPKSTDYSSVKSELFTLTINEDLTLTKEGENFILEPFDVIIVRKSPQYKVQATVRIEGQVLLPGLYTLDKESVYLSDIAELAKGFTNEAHIMASSLQRRYNNEGDRQLNKIVAKIQSSMMGKDTLIHKNNSDTYTIAINLENALKDPKGKDDLLLEEGDVIVVPKIKNVVNTIGSVYYPNATKYNGKKLKYYILSSGGYSKMARKKPFVIYANGTVATTKAFIFKKYPKIEPGCIIVVPMKNPKNRMTPAEILSIATGTTSLAASLTSMGILFGK